MKQLAAVFILLVGVAAVAQNAPLPTLPFTFTATALALPSGTTFAGTDAGVSVSPNEYVTIADHNIISADGILNYYGGGLDVNFPQLSVGVNNMTPTMSGFRLLFSAGGSVGESRVNLATTQVHWGGELHGSVSYALTSTGTWQLGIRAGAGRFPYYTAKGWIPIISLGPSFHF